MKNLCLLTLFTQFSFFLLGQQTWHVAPTSQNLGDGSSWENACHFQYALNNAAIDDTIWMKTGVYKPLESFPGILAASERDFVFYIIDKTLRIFGGFQGNETNFSERVEGYPTIIDGELGDPTVATDNQKYLLVYDKSDAAYLPANSIFDGLTFQNAYCEENFFMPGVSDNGTVSVQQSSTFLKCKFYNNYNQFRGGGITASNGQVTFRFCEFHGNESGDQAGAIYSCNNANIYVFSCNFWNNNSPIGSAIKVQQGFDGASEVSNCIFENNKSTNGTIQVFSSTINVYHNTFYNNFVDENQIQPLSGLSFFNPIAAVISGNIFYSDNTSDQAYVVQSGSASNFIVSNNMFSNGQGGVNQGTNFINEDPNFTDPVDDANYALTFCSPALDRVTDWPNWTSGFGNFDYFGNPRVVGSATDLGAIEFTPLSSELGSFTMSNNVTIFAPYAVGYSYQWVNCDNDQIIPDETEFSFTTTESGTFKAIITSDTCEVETDCLIVTLGSSNVLSENLETITIYPNPTTGALFFDQHADIKKTQVFDLNGRLIFEIEHANNQNSIDVSHLESGLYLLSMDLGGRIITTKFQKY